MEKDKKVNISLIKQEINKELADPKIFANLMQITFKGLKPEIAKMALLEGMITGFTFKDFLEKNVYAVPFKTGFSLVNSISYVRKIGMRSGIVGVSAPIYTDDDKGKIITCEVTVKRKVGNAIGEFTALVYFNEYNTNYNVWKSKPRTMIAKVAETHALRKACPEELSQSYIAEEYDKETKFVEDTKANTEKDKKTFIKAMNDCKTIEELSTKWETIPAVLKADKEILNLKDKLKAKLSKTDTIEGEVVK